jgi:hypothetical protein
MSISELEEFRERPFSFYPPILGVEHNEWTYGEANWSEIRVHNPKANLDVWIPRRHVGQLSSIDDPVMIVGLTQELEYKGGMVMAHHSRVVTMPRGGSSPLPGHRQASVPPRSRSGGGSVAEQKVGRLIAGVLLVAIAGTFLTVMLTRDRGSGGRINYQAVLQAELGLTAQDDYFAVVRKLGKPAQERWRDDVGERQYQALWYPELGVTAILMGASRDQVLYIGAKDENWKNVHSVKLPGGSSTDSILRSLERF